MIKVPRSLDPSYSEKVWTPTWTGLTVVGAPTYAGTYVRIGRLFFLTVQITAGGANTTASTAGGTYVNNLPIAPGVNGVLGAVTNGVVDLGTSLIQASTGRAYTPTWAATNANITISGFFFI